MSKNIAFNLTWFVYYSIVFWFFLEGFILIFESFIDMISIYSILGLSLIQLDSKFIYFLLAGIGLIIIGILVGKIAIEEELLTLAFWTIHAIFVIPISIILCLFLPYTITSWVILLGVAIFDIIFDVWDKTKHSFKSRTIIKI